MNVSVFRMAYTMNQIAVGQHNNKTTKNHTFSYFVFNFTVFSLIYHVRSLFIQFLKWIAGERKHINKRRCVKNYVGE